LIETGAPIERVVSVAAVQRVEPTGTVQRVVAAFAEQGINEGPANEIVRSWSASECCHSSPPPMQNIAAWRTGSIMFRVDNEVPSELRHLHLLGGDELQERGLALLRRLDAALDRRNNVGG